MSSGRPLSGRFMKATVAVDRDGNIYGGEPAPKRLQKYVRVRP